MPIRRTECAVLAMAALTACAKDTMLLEGDIPLPEGLVTVRSADIRRADGVVTGGRFILSGEVADAGAAMTASAERFAAHGWTRASSEGDADAAKARFTKGARAVDLELRRRGLDTRNSQGVLSVASGGS